ncbi:hypothetical protein H0H92_003401 [Tricholoma furcatifolium]|nr:hypothetical protein H0H92_003401 [Tricholoma furcatifolium]
MAASTAYIAASTNRHPQAAHISKNSLSAFGSSNLVALWNISWEIAAKLQAHSQAISSLCALDDRIVTGSSDATVKIWKIVAGTDETDSFVEEQLLPLRGRYPLSLAITNLPGSKVLVLAIGSTDSKIHIWARSDNLFVQASVLAGHEDWIKTLDFQINSEGQPLVLASGSQDATIRLWNIEPWSPSNSAPQKGQTDGLSDELLDAFEASLADVGEAEEGGRQISLKRHILTVKSDQGTPQQFSITFDALLIGHEAGITSLAWKPPSAGGDSTLLSTSTDSSMILWSPSTVAAPTKEGSTSIWINRQRFGDIGGQRLGGFVGGAWAENGTEALAWGWAGGWRRWRCTSNASLAHEETWMEVGAISGHNGPVKGLDWSPTGSYLLSAGLDQTTRIHGVTSSAVGVSGWHELSRPQVHGYDLLDVAFIDRLRFASIADEKVVRVFEAPGNFVDLAAELGHNRPIGANVPPLGLSNKAMDDAQAPMSRRETSKRRPFEGELAAMTLWPEIEKSITLTISPNKRFMATACKATTPDHAVVRVYETTKYQPVGQPLAGHSLTVTRIAFSPDENFVLSVSRDRSWRLFKAQECGGFVAVAADKSHGRIIWDCAWAAEGDVFATASRDKTVKIWHRQLEDQWSAIETIQSSSPATAVAFAPGGEQYRLAHVNHIHRLAWQPTEFGASTKLASCSEDGTLKITIVEMAIE